MGSQRPDCSASCGYVGMLAATNRPGPASNISPRAISRRLFGEKSGRRPLMIVGRAYPKELLSIDIRTSPTSSRSLVSRWRLDWLGQPTGRHSAELRASYAIHFRRVTGPAMSSVLARRWCSFVMYRRSARLFSVRIFIGPAPQSPRPPLPPQLPGRPVRQRRRYRVSVLPLHTRAGGVSPALRSTYEDRCGSATDGRDDGPGRTLPSL